MTLADKLKHDDCPLSLTCWYFQMTLKFAIGFLRTKDFVYIRQETKHARWIPTQSLSAESGMLSWITGYFLAYS